MHVFENISLSELSRPQSLGKCIWDFSKSPEYICLEMFSHFSNLSFSKVWFTVAAPLQIGSMGLPAYSSCAHPFTPLPSGVLLNTTEELQ